MLRMGRQKEAAGLFLGRFLHQAPALRDCHPHLTVSLFEGDLVLEFDAVRATFFL
ncbi:MAG TPA: hypothetical protein VF605_19990 [Allosphingosinicella sp.]|jgi:hypothetical protein